MDWSTRLYGRSETRREEVKMGKQKVRHFKSKEAYYKWVQHGHISNVFEKTKGHTKIYIAGKLYRPKHKKK
jgi:hypothetical protein